MKIKNITATCLVLCAFVEGSAQAGTIKLLASFEGLNSALPEGAALLHASFDYEIGDSPLAGLIQGSDGNFYGTTVYGGSANQGVIFEYIP